jgi:hypothetical protein
VRIAGDNQGMNESVIPSSFMIVVILIALAQTALLMLACMLIREWGGNLNRKLHRIESNTRHAASALAPEQEEVLGKGT